MSTEETEEFKNILEYNKKRKSPHFVECPNC